MNFKGMVYSHKLLNKLMENVERHTYDVSIETNIKKYHRFSLIL